MLISSRAQALSLAVHSASTHRFGLFIQISVVGFWLLSFILLLALPAQAQPSTFSFEGISTEQILSQSTANAITQDRQGFLP